MADTYRIDISIPMWAVYLAITIIALPIGTIWFNGINILAAEVAWYYALQYYRMYGARYYIKYGLLIVYGMIILDTHPILAMIGGTTLLLAENCQN